MTLGERIKKMRKDLNLTQREFASRIGTTQNVLANYETGRRNPSASALNNICKTFNLSETWLRTGEGEPTLPTPEESVDELIKQYGLQELDRQIILEFIKLKPEDRQAVITFVRNIAKHLPQEKTLEEKADEFAAMAREQFLSEQEQALQALSANGSEGE